MAVEVRVELLDAVSPLFERVVEWHWHEWSNGLSDADRAAWRARLATRCRDDGIPFTLVAFADGEPVGCLTVCHDDLDARFADRGPWLSGVLVAGPARNLGVGRALVRAAEARAAAFGAREMWLWTSEAGPFYARCGYTVVARKEDVAGHAVLWRALDAGAPAAS